MAQPSVGMDITEKEIKTVQLISKSPQPILLAHSRIKRDQLEDIKAFLQESSIRRSKLHVSLQDGALKTKVVTVPQVPKEEQEEVIAWAFKEAAKVPPENHTLRHYPIPGAPEGQQSYVVMAVERKRIQNYFIELQKLGLKNPSLIEPQIQALANCIIHNYELKNSERYAVVHLGAEISYCATISVDGVLFYRNFSHIDTSNAEQLLSKIGVEIQYSCQNYTETFPKNPITHVLLCGDRSNLPSLQGTIQELTSLSPIFLEPFKKIMLTEQQKKELENDASAYCIAVGLAL